MNTHGRDNCVAILCISLFHDVHRLNTDPFSILFVMVYKNRNVNKKEGTANGNLLKWNDIWMVEFSEVFDIGFFNIPDFLHCYFFSI